MMKGSVSLNHPGSFPSRGASYYRDNGLVVAKKGGIQRECHVQLRSMVAAAEDISVLHFFTPFYSGRRLPSKGEDADRLICSPVLGYGVSKNANYRLQRRLKSKTGPIVPPGTAFYSNCSPSMVAKISAWENLQRAKAEAAIRKLEMKLEKEER